MTSIDRFIAQAEKVMGERIGTATLTPNPSPKWERGLKATAIL